MRVAFLFSFLCTGAHVLAQMLIPITDEFKVDQDQYPNSTQEHVDIAVAEDGSYVVLWRDPSAVPTPTQGVMIRRFSAVHNPLESEEMIGTSSPLPNYRSTVTYWDEGRYVLRWFNNLSLLQADGQHDGEVPFSSLIRTSEMIRGDTLYHIYSTLQNIGIRKHALPEFQPEWFMSLISDEGNTYELPRIFVRSDGALSIL
jgi:hypothetical protein